MSREVVLAALERAIYRAIVTDRELPPGTVIKRMSRDDRALLERLTSDDACAMRPRLLLPPTEGR